MHMEGGLCIRAAALLHCVHKCRSLNHELSVFLLVQYSDDDEISGVTQGDRLRALKSRRQSKTSALPLT